MGEVQFSSINFPGTISNHKFFKNELVNNCSLSIVYNDVLKNDDHRQNFEKIFMYKTNNRSSCV